LSFGKGLWIRNLKEDANGTEAVLNHVFDGDYSNLAGKKVKKHPDGVKETEECENEPHDLLPKANVSGKQDGDDRPNWVAVAGMIARGCAMARGCTIAVECIAFRG
jgi:hypothetical protein